MTREMVIETLNGIRKWYNGISKELVIGEKQIAAFEMAIEDMTFLEFLFNTINPNEMEQYLAMYHSKEEKNEWMS